MGFWGPKENLSHGGSGGDLPVKVEISLLPYYPFPFAIKVNLRFNVTSYVNSYIIQNNIRILKQESYTSYN